MRIMFRLVFFVIRLQFHLMKVKHLSNEPSNLLSINRAKPLLITASSFVTAVIDRHSAPERDNPLANQSNLVVTSDMKL